jgi:hypothetical protein
LAEKDRFGNKLRDKEKAEENLYFAERDKELLKKLKPKQPAEVPMPTMLCPKCNGKLIERTFRDVVIDECSGCKGIWLDKGELEALTEPEQAGWIAAFLGRKKRG